MKNINALNKLNDDQLKVISGGNGSTQETVKAHCPFCNKDDPEGKSDFLLLQGAQGKCTSCGNVITI